MKILCDESTNMCGMCVSWLMLIMPGHGEALTALPVLNDGDDVNKHGEEVTTPLFTI